MDKQGVVTGSVALALIIAVLAAGYWYLSDMQQDKGALPVDTTYEKPAEVVVTHRVDDERHVFSGAIPMSNTCNKVATGISTEEADGRLRVSLAIGILQLQGNCQAVTGGVTQNFVAAFVPQGDLPVDLVEVTVNGKPVEFTTN